MINFNLNLLKFHSFYYNKKITNQWRKNGDKQLKNKESIIDYLILKKFNNMINHFSSFRKLDEIILDLKKGSKSKSVHVYDYNRKKILFDVIKYCHKNLYSEIEQLFFEKLTIEKLCVYQFPLDKRSRIICIFNDSFIYPIIIDLNHCFYETKKTYDNNSGKTQEWDFKKRQQEIKCFLLKNKNI